MTDKITEKKFKTFTDFWPFYLGEHAHPLNRALHFTGISAALLCGFAAMENQKPALYILMPILGYGFAWFGHFVVEKNRPATFQHPLFSLIGDFKMVALMLTGRMRPELQRLRVQVPSKSPFSSGA